MWVACEAATVPMPGAKAVIISLGGSAFVRVEAGEDIPDGALVGIAKDGMAYRVKLGYMRVPIGYAVCDSTIIE